MIIVTKYLKLGHILYLSVKLLAMEKHIQPTEVPTHVLRLTIGNLSKGT